MIIVRKYYYCRSSANRSWCKILSVCLEEGQDKFTRKFDDDFQRLKNLRELYYHTKEDSRYISELKKALVDSVFMKMSETCYQQLTLKLDFKGTDFYRDGHVFYNKKIPKSFDK
jgi:type III restriction enzyme